MITGKAKLAGVMGWPVSHSRSPRLHGYWLEHYGIDGAYVPMAVPPDKLSQALRARPHLGFRGVNLTLPHKEAALGIIEHIDPAAKRIGAINTVVVRDDHTLEGRNTDAFGFTENIKQAGFSLNANPIATVLGAGGAARAVIVTLQDMGFTEIRLVNRTPKRAEQLAHELEQAGCVITVTPPSQTAAALADTALLVNTTSLGMVGQPPLELDLKTLPQAAWVTDIVYVPLVTDFLARAAAHGCRTVDGLGMLLHQARPGFKAWFGVEPEVTATLREFVMEEAS